MNYQIGSSQRIDPRQLLQLTKDTPIHREYRFIFPNSQVVGLSIAIVKNIPFSQGKFSFQRVEQVVVDIHRIQDMEKWLQSLAIRKRLFQLKIGLPMDNTIFSGFDAVIIKDTIEIGVYTCSSYEQLRKYPQESLLRMKNQYKYIMNDLQMHHISLNGVVPQLGLSPTWKPIIISNEDFSIFRYKLEDYQFQPQLRQKVNPYFADSLIIERHLANLLHHQSTKQVEHKVYPEWQFQEMQALIKYTGLLSRIISTKLSLILSDGAEFDVVSSQLLSDIQGYYCIEHRRDDLEKLLLLKSSKKRFPKNSCQLLQISKDMELLLCLQQDNKITEILSRPQGQGQGFTKSFLSKMNSKTFNKRQFFSSKLGLLEPINKPHNCKSQSKRNQARVHFWRAKDSWMEGNLYRSLAHLKQSERHGTQSERSIIYLEMGRIWSRLCDFHNSEQYYLKSRDIKRSIFGSQSIKLLPVLQNLLYLYSKVNERHKFMNVLRQCNHIKHLYQQKHLIILPQLIYSFHNQIVVNQDSSILETDFKVISSPRLKELNKDDLIKIENERVSYLQKIWPLLKVIEKISKKECENLENNREIMEYGQLFNLSYLLQLIYALSMKEDLKAEQQFVIKMSLQKLRLNNIQMHDRIAFMLSFYFDRKGAIDEAIFYLKFVLSGEEIPHNIKDQLSKKYLALLKRKQDGQSELLLYYAHNVDIFRDGMTEELFHSVKLFYSKNMLLECVKNCNIYLKNIRLYPSIPQESSQDNPTCKVKIDRSQRVNSILAGCLTSCRQFDQAQKIINSLTQSFFIKNRNQYNLLLVKFITEAFQEEEYAFALNGFNKLRERDNEATNQNKQLWVIVVTCVVLLNVDAKPYICWISDNFRVQFMDANKKQKLIKAVAKRQTNSYRALAQLLGNLDEDTLKFEQHTFQHVCSAIMEISRTDTKSQRIIESRMEFIKFIKEKGKQQIWTLINLIVPLINLRVKDYGKSSLAIIYLHCLLLETFREVGERYCEVLILMWLISIRPYTIHLDQNQTQVSKRNQSRFDTLVHQLLQLDSFPLSTSVLNLLWWHDGKQQLLRQLWRSYKLIQGESNGKDVSMQATDFKIKYLSYFTSFPSDSLVLADLEMNSLSDIDDDLID